MKRSNKKVFSIALICWIIFATVFILLNSVMGFNASHSFSRWVLDILGVESSGEAGGGDFVLRKIAHITEYALLGMGVFALTIKLNKVFNKNFFGFALFYSLAVGVIDEHIQSFSDRNSSTGDIILDFLGILIGFLVMFIIIKVCSKIKACSKRVKTEEVK